MTKTLTTTVAFSLLAGWFASGQNILLAPSSKPGPPPLAKMVWLPAPGLNEEPEPKPELEPAASDPAADNPCTVDERPALVSVVTSLARIWQAVHVSAPLHLLGKISGGGEAAYCFGTVTNCQWQCPAECDCFPFWPVWVCMS